MDTGKFKNEGQTTARNVSIEVELFGKDKKNSLMSTENRFYISTVKPGEERNFKVSCGGLNVWNSWNPWNVWNRLRSTT
jgi:hypothetical protein